jgi:hypothetical protein
MKVTCMPNKVLDENSSEKSIMGSIFRIEKDEPNPNLDTVSIVEFVKQRRIDALRIKELTLRALEILGNQNNSGKTCLEASTINSGLDINTEGGN